MSIDINTIIAVIMAAIAFWVGWRGTHSDDKNLQNIDHESVRRTAYNEGRIDSKLDTISATVSRMDSKLDRVDASIDKLSERITAVEQSAKSAHHRIDGIEGKKTKSEGDIK